MFILGIVLIISAIELPHSLLQKSILILQQLLNLMERYKKMELLLYDLTQEAEIKFKRLQRE